MSTAGQPLGYSSMGPVLLANILEALLWGSTGVRKKPESRNQRNHGGAHRANEGEGGFKYIFKSILMTLTFK